MPQYEAMIIYRSGLEEEQQETEIEKCKSVVEENGGQVTNLNKWGTKKLAYEIDKVKEGYYLLMNFDSNSDVVTELDRRLKINEQVIRHLIVREEEKK